MLDQEVYEFGTKFYKNIPLSMYKYKKRYGSYCAFNLEKILEGQENYYIRMGASRRRG
jgi:hypothetical protein